MGFLPFIIDIFQEVEEEDDDKDAKEEASTSEEEVEEDGLQQTGVEFKWFDDLYIFNTGVYVPPEHNILNL